MKKSFMTRVLAVSLSTAMAFSLSPVSNLTTASAASTVQISTTFKTVKVGQSATLKLKNNTLDWKISKVKTTDKTTCTVYGKTASNVKIKGKKVGRATITITATSAKRKKKGGVSTKNMKCRANVIAAEAAFTASATASSNTSATVTFSEAVDAATIDNFAISGGSARISEVALSADKKSAALTLAGTEANTEYTLTTTGLSVGGKAVANQTIKFKTPEAQVAETKAALVLTSDLEKPYLKSDGASSTVITCEIRDAQGKVMENADVEVRFTTTRGNLGSERVTAQKGKASTTLRSEFSNTNVRTVITATVVESRTNPELINSSGTMDITMTPNPDDFVTTTGAVLTSAESNQADRVTAFFNKKVNVNDYLYANKEINPSKAEVTVYNAVNNSYQITSNTQTIKVVGLVPVEGNSQAMQLILESPLTDNSNIGVKFKDKTGTQSTENEAFFKLTDARQPAAVNVDNVGYRTIEADFSESVLSKAAVEKAGDKTYNNTGNTYSADQDVTGNGKTHFLIDGVPIDNGQYGSPNTDKSKGSYPQVIVGGFNEDKNGTDNRERVTIKLGRKASDNSRTYLAPGSHSLQIVNVGDWAAYTDGTANVLQTQTLDFTVEEDNTLPDIQSVVVQSPEQYLVTFTSPIDRTILDKKDGKDKIKLEYNNNGTWEDVTTYKPNSSSTLQKVDIEPIYTDSSKEELQQCIVQVGVDWTQYFKTGSTNDNYYRHQFRLSIDKEDLENTNNGKKNSSAITHVLTGDMITQPDNTSPVIGEIEEKTDSNDNVYYSVPMNEPVKIIDKDGNVVNKVGATPSELQNGSIPKPTISFIRKSDFTTIDGELIGFDTDSQTAETYDQILKVQPKGGATLSNGTWILVVRSISDDVGNTAASLTKEFESTVATKEQTFKVLWSAVANEFVDGDNEAGTIATYEDILCWDNYGKPSIKKGRYIFVKFSDAIQVSGASANVLATENYTINGRPLPTNTRILANIKGYDNEGGETDSITIVLPEESSAVDGVSTVLNISPAVQSKSGKRLAGDHELKLPYRLPHAHDEHEDPKSDAVWGNHASEMAKSAGGELADSSYKKSLQAALDDDSYGRIVINGDVQGKLTVSHPVVIDVNGSPLDEIEFNYTKGGKSVIENNHTTSKGVIGKITVDTPNASFEINGEADEKIVVTDKVIVNKTPNGTFKNFGAKINAMDVLADNARVFNNKKGTIGVMSVKAEGTTVANEGNIASVTVEEEAKNIELKNNGTISEATILSKNTTTVNNEGTIKTTTVDTSGKVNLTGSSKFDTVVVNNASATITVKDGASVDTVDAKDAKGTVKIEVEGTAKVEAVVGDVTVKKGEEEQKPNTVIGKGDEEQATTAAAKYFVEAVDISSTSSEAIKLVNTEATSEEAIEVSKISVLSEKKKDSSAAKYLSVDETEVVNGNWKKAVTYKVPTTKVTEYILVEGTVEVKGAKVKFEQYIPVNFN
ncbi:MAG: hypothetical protein HFH35_08585 [Eubacterium sp.]|nr:hypothetical protein [Eubacterium sp.]